MFDLTKDNGPKPRCLVTNTKLSNFLNHEQPPTKKRPFSTILNQTFTHSLTLILPTSPTSTFQQALSKPTNSPYTLHYSKLHLKLSTLLSNPLFTTHIKSPQSSTSLTFLSTGPTANPYGGTFTLHDGILTLDLDRPTYERTGLQGKSMPSQGGRKHAKDRFWVELNLRLPSMLHGKKGFERVLWVCENVLDESCTWLVYDAKSGGFESGLTGEEGGVLRDFAPVERKVQPQVVMLEDVLVPAFPEDGSVKEEDYADAAELLEWLSLAMLDSPRIRKDDAVDRHFSRYQIPNAFGEPTMGSISKFHWNGLIPPQFAYKIFLAALKASGEDWVAMSGSSFDGETYTILVHKGHSIIWEYKD